MNKGLALLLIMFIFTVTAVFAGTPFEDDHKTWDPYLADTQGGFDSLFVNPAGLAGQTEIFSLAVEGRGRVHIGFSFPVRN